MPGEGIICLSDQYPKPRVWQPRETRHQTPRSEPLRGFLFGLAPDGVYRAPLIALGAVGSYPAFSPLLRPVKHRKQSGLFSVALSVRISRDIASRVYPESVDSGYTASCPMEFGLSSSSFHRKRFPALSEPRQLYVRLSRLTRYVAKTSRFAIQSAEFPLFQAIPLNSLVHHRKIHMPRIVENSTAVGAADDFLLLLTGKNYLSG